MESSTTLTSTKAATAQRCSYCEKSGHKASKCWVKNPEQRKAFIERRYGKRKNIRKRQSNAGPSNDDVDESHVATLPILKNQTIAGPSRMRASDSLSKVDDQGKPPRTEQKNKRSRNASKNKPTVPKKSKPELLYFVPVGKSSLPRKPKTTSLNDLPDELVLKILEHFDPCRHVTDVASGDMGLFNGGSWPYKVIEDRRMLKRICLSSRRLYSMARPILGSLVRDTGKVQQRLMLIERFIRNPIAASYVRIIFVEGMEILPSKMKSAKIGQNILSVAEMIDIEEQELPDNPSRERFRKEDWMLHIQKSGSDAKVAMMLALLPKLEILHLSISSMTLAEDFPWTLALMRRAGERRRAPGLGPFSKLHTILTARSNLGLATPGFNPNGLACALGLPTLRYVSLYLARSQIDWPIAESNIETLHFEESAVDSEYLRNILTACKSLRHFSLTWPMELEIGISGAEAGYSGLLENLSTQKHSLETLTLDSADVDWFARWEAPGLARIGSLAKFDKLQTVEIGGEHIIGGIPYTHSLADSDTESDTEDTTYEVNGRPLDYHELADIFPPSLETLKFNSPGQSARHFMPLLVEIARACKLEKRLPKLKTVDAEQCFMKQSITRHQALLDQAAGFFTDAGVVFLPPYFNGSEYEDRWSPTDWGESIEDDMWESHFNYTFDDYLDRDGWYDDGGDGFYAGFM
ncbi:f-box domain cyclin-like protein [Venturia nashicola]|nr:f-box domain cyclin-like protein [Venturia nashicola]